MVVTNEPSELVMWGFVDRCIIKLPTDYLCSFCKSIYRLGDVTEIYNSIRKVYLQALQVLYLGTEVF